MLLLIQLSLADLAPQQPFPFSSLPYPLLPFYPSGIPGADLTDSNLKPSVLLIGLLLVINHGARVPLTGCATDAFRI